MTRDRRFAPAHRHQYPIRHRHPSKARMDRINLAAHMDAVHGFRYPHETFAWLKHHHDADHAESDRKDRLPPGARTLSPSDESSTEANDD